MAKVYDFKSKQLVFEDKQDAINPYFGMEYDVLFKEITVFYEIKKKKGLNINLIEKAIPLFKEFSKVAKNDKMKKQAEEALQFLEFQLKISKVN